jgi:ankyrin repeat protein
MYAYQQLAKPFKKVIRFLLQPEILKLLQLGIFKQMILTMVKTWANPERIISPKKIQEETPHQVLMTKTKEKQQKMFDIITETRLNQKLPASFDPIIFDESDKIEEFFATIRQNDFLKFQQMISDNPTLVSECNDKLETALHIACKCINIEMCYELRSFGASKDAKDIKGATPVTIAKVMDDMELQIIL